MKQVGHGDAQMFFYVDSASVLAGKIGSGVKVLAEESHYRHIPRNGLKLSTKISMAVSGPVRYGEDGAVKTIETFCVKRGEILP